MNTDKRESGFSGVARLACEVATTHHEFLDQLEKDFPEIQVKRCVRFVEGEKISTAGGLTSGTDLALRVVERYFGRADRGLHGISARSLDGVEVGSRKDFRV